MRYFFRLRFPNVERILLVESGSRHLIEHVLPVLRSYWPDAPIDLVTCYAGEPEGISGVYRVTDYPGRANRKRLYDELKSRGYAVMGIVCSNEPIMTKWKWALAAHVPAKVFALNENGDFFWLDRSQWRTMRHFVLYRAGLSGAQAVPALLRLALFPFTVVYLLLYAAAVHVRRFLRLRFRKANA